LKLKEELKEEKSRREIAEQELSDKLSRFEYHKEQNEYLEKKNLNYL